MNKNNQVNKSKINKYQKYILKSNILINELLNQGFKTVYDQLYSHVTTNEELYDIKSKCNTESIICVGGSDDVNNLLLVSCGSCLDILTITDRFVPKLINGAYWYFTPDISFGFSPNSKIDQNYYDCYDCPNCNDNSNICTDSNRLSWKLSGYTGFRLGKNCGNAIPSTNRKIILLK